MRLARCIGTLAVGLGLALGVSVGTATRVAALCGDGVTTAGEACDTGTPVCQVPSKNVGAECNKDADCNGGLCGCVGGSCNNGVGNRDDVSDACRSTCMGPMCGDGVSDGAFGEQCDNGAANAENAGCLPARSTCVGGFFNGLGCTTNADCTHPVLSGACTANLGCLLAACGDGLLCTATDCPNVRIDLITQAAAPEACDDGNTSNMDNCMPAGQTIVVGGSQVLPVQCGENLCGDGISEMGVEQCDLGISVCAIGPKVGKFCCSNDDCQVGNVTGICLGALTGADNLDAPNSACRCSCELPFCGDGISDNLLGEECDDGTTANAQGEYCNTVRSCVGGENPGAVCTSNADCVKGTCGPELCVQNSCGDGVLAANEQCDDGNTVLPTGTNGDTCGVSTTVAAGLYKLLGCTNADPDLGGTGVENAPGSCPQNECTLPLCGDGVTNAGEMCDGGFAICSDALATAAGVTLFNPNALCVKASDCKTSKTAAGASPNVCSSVVTGANASDLPDHCRPNCMPPTCGDGVSDQGEQCEPPASGTFCIKNALGMCVLNVCGDGDVCNKAATDSFGVVQNCTGGPVVDPITGAPIAASGGNEQCDDANTVNPAATNLDVCTTAGTVLPQGQCAASRCGDNVTNPGLGEQCDSTGMGCSNMQEDLSQPEMVADCCIDGDVVSGDKVNALPGLLSVEQGYASLLGCRLPNLIAASTCDRLLNKRFTKVRDKVLASEVSFENNDITKARRQMRQAARILRHCTYSHIARAVRPGKPCAPNGAAIANQTANASDLAEDVVSELIQNNNHFAP